MVSGGEKTAGNVKPLTVGGGAKRKKGLTKKPGGLVGERVRERRKMLNLTQSALAERAGLPQETISKVEVGAISGRTAAVQEALAKALGTSVAYLRGEVESDGVSRQEDRIIATVAHDRAYSLEAKLMRDDPRYQLVAQTLELLGSLYDPQKHHVLDVAAAACAITHIVPWGRMTEDLARRTLSLATFLRSSNQTNLTRHLEVYLWEIMAELTNSTDF